MSSAPTFSIIMAAYNATATIREALASAQAQTMRDFELIIVDDGSTDGTGAVVAEYAARDPRIRVISQENAGANAARNRALGEARGRYVTFLDTDDLKLPRYLECAVTAFESEPDAGIAYSDSWILDDRTRRIYRRGYIESQRGPDPPPRDTESLIAALVEDCFFPFSGTSVRGSTLESVGFFDPGIAGTDDLDLFMRIVLAGHGAARIPGRLAVMRRIEGQISGDAAVMLTNLRLTYQKVVDDPATPERVRVRARQRMQELRPGIDVATAPERPRHPLVQRAVDALWRVRLSITWPRAWRVTLPGEIREAFPDLRRSA